MSKFYGSMGYITCGNGCSAKMQSLLFNENDQPYDMDWNTLAVIYMNHTNNCSVEDPLLVDENCFYGDPNKCTGFCEEGIPESGYKYCEF